MTPRWDDRKAVTGTLRFGPKHVDLEVAIPDEAEVETVLVTWSWEEALGIARAILQGAEERGIT